MSQSSAVVKMVNITKEFPGVIANDKINFEARKGEIHALLGENGAGKTTLMNILYGLYQPDEGEIYVHGRKVTIRSPRDAIDLKIGMIHQHFTLIPPFTVTQNIILGLKFPKGILKIKEAEDKVAELSKKYGLKVDPRAQIWQLSVGEQQRVEILKALYREAEIFILDEPTSVLTPTETRDLFKVLKTLVRDGATVIFISHKLDEVLEISDRVTVLRGGKLVTTKETSATNKRELAQLMVDREVIFRLESPKVRLGRPLLEVEKVSALGDMGLLALKEVSFSVHEGEILGIAGVAGNGQRELAEVIAGVRKVTEGKVIINGKDMTNKPPSEIVGAGVGRIPEDRINSGLLMGLSVKENLVMETLHDFSDQISFFPRGIFLSQSKIDEYADKLISEFKIITSSKDAPAKTLSGGNLQKLILARVLAQSPKILIASEPTRGLDVGATEYIRRELLEQKKEGAAILLISEDLEEILSLSDRIAVMYEGKVMGIVPAREARIEEIGLMMAGTPLSKVEG
ncbi:MAG: ABC transporter ATP-binding protein [Candidatus Bathyarchaeia archaeon]